MGAVLGRFWPGVAIAMLVAFFVVDGIYLYARDAYRNDLEVTSIDLGQGSSTLVRFPGSRKMLINGGGFPDSDFDVGKYVLAPLLWHERIKKVQRCTGPTGTEPLPLLLTAGGWKRKSSKRGDPYPSTTFD